MRAGMAEAAAAGSGHVAASSGAAQQGHQPLQPDAAASTDAASLPAPGIPGLVQVLVRMDLAELEHWSEFSLKLDGVHQHSRLWEERDALYQQLAARLHFGRRCARTSALLERLSAEIPVDACHGTSSTELFHHFPAYMDSLEFSAKDRVEAWRALMSLEPSSPLLSAAESYIQRAAANRIPSSFVRNSHECRQLLLGEARKYGQVSTAAMAIIGCLDAQAR